MKSHEKRRTRGSKPPAWMIDELNRDPELLRLVVEIVRTFRNAAKKPTE